MELLSDSLYNSNIIIYLYIILYNYSIKNTAKAINIGICTESICYLYYTIVQICVLITTNHVITCEPTLSRVVPRDHVLAHVGFVGGNNLSMKINRKARSCLFCSIILLTAYLACVPSVSCCSTV